MMLNLKYLSLYIFQNMIAFNKLDDHLYSYH